MLIENGIKPILHENTGIMYVFKTNEEDDYKVGTAKNPHARFKSHNCSLATNLELKYRYEVKDKSRVDSCVKNVLKPWLIRKDREIYRAKLSKIIDAISNCDELINKFSIKHDQSRMKNDNNLYYLIITTESDEHVVKKYIEKEVKDDCDNHISDYERYKGEYLRLKVLKKL